MSFAFGCVTFAVAASASAGSTDTGSLDAAVGIATAFGDPFASALHWARGPVLTLLLGAGLGSLWSRRVPGAGECLGAALLLAILAQSWLLDGAFALGLGVYGLAAACALARTGADAPEPRTPSPPPWLELLVVPLLLLAFVAVCLDGLEWLPRLHLDEWAYYRAALMESGVIPEGDVISRFGETLYTFDRFRAQPIPLALHAFTLEWLGPGIWGLRLVSVASGVLALGAGYVVTRRILGPLAALATLALGAGAPLLIAYARPGHYIAPSVAHGALCLWLFVGWLGRPSRGRGFALGAALGAGLRGKPPPTLGQPGRRAFWALTEEVRGLGSTSRRLQRALADGAGMEETHPTFQRLVRSGRRAVREVRRIDLGQTTLANIDAVADGIRRLRPYYEPGAPI